MYVDPSLTAAGFAVGTLVGLVGTGGGALLTPLLILLFRSPPLTAISSDLLTSLVMKPVGAVVHIRHRTVHWRLAGWLAAGAVPCGFAGAFLIGTLGRRAGTSDQLTVLVGAALCLSVAATTARQMLDRRTRRRTGDDGRPVVVRPCRTLLIGAVGGLAVGMTSVGAGSLIMALVMLAYPELRPSQLVGTDIVQAVPLVASATAGHLVFGDVRLMLTTSLIVGAVPGVYLGARLSARGPAWVLRPVIVAVLLTSALALLGVGLPWLLAGTVAVLLLNVLLGLPPRTPSGHETVPGGPRPSRAGDRPVRPPPAPPASGISR